MRGLGGLEGVPSPQKAEDVRSCTPTGDRGWASLSRLEDGTSRRSDGMGCAWLVLHTREPLFFKTAGSPPCAEWPGSNGVVVQCLRRVAGFLPLACKAGGIHTSMPGTRALNSSSSSPPCPYCPVSILHSLYYSSSLTLSKKNTVYTHPQTTHTTLLPPSFSPSSSSTNITPL